MNSLPATPRALSIGAVIAGFLMVSIWVHGTPLITQVVETGGIQEATDTIPAKFTGETFSNGVPEEYFYPYSVPRFAEDTRCFVDRVHQYNGATASGLPAYLTGGEYILIGNDNRVQTGFRLDVTVAASATIYLLIDNRLTDWNPDDPPESGAPLASWVLMKWVGEDGFTPVRTGANRWNDANLPDEVGVDERGDGIGPGESIDNWYSVYSRTVAGGTFQLKEANQSNQNMYGVVVTGTDHQGLSWVSPAPGMSLRIGQPYPLIATSNRGLPVTYRVEIGSATIANGNITATAPGSLIVSAEQAGNGSYAPAAVRRAFNRPTAQIERVDQWPGFARGEARAVVTANGYAYVAAGRGGLTIFDLTDPDHPARVFSRSPIWDSSGVTIAGNRLYLVDTIGAIEIFDLAEPTNPVRLGGDQRTGFYLGIAVEGDRAYVANGGAGLQIFNVSDPSNPLWLGSYDTQGLALNVSTSNGRIYVADDSAGIQILDATDPAHPTLLGTYDTPGLARSVTVAGGHAYVADTDAGMHIIDIENPAQPTLLGSILTDGPAYDLVFVNNQVHVAAGHSGLRIVDVSNPEHPALIGDGLDTPEWAARLSVSGVLTFIADSSGGLQIIDVTHPASPTARGIGETAGSSHNVVIGGNLGALADGPGGVHFFDLTQSQHPVRVSSFRTLGVAENVGLLGSRAYVAEGQYGLRILDVSDPEAPASLHQLNIGGYAVEVALTADLAFVGMSWGGVRIVDVSNPSAPHILGTLEIQGQVRGIAISENLAFVAGWESDVSIFDFSQPEHPVLVSHVNTGYRPTSVALKGTTLLVSDEWSGVLLFDVSDPAAPRWMGGLDTPGLPRRFNLVGDLLLLSEDDTLQLFDVADPGQPAPLGSYRTPGQVMGAASADHVVYVADENQGLQVLSSRVGLPQTITFDPPAGLAPGAPPVVLTAEANSGLPVSLAVESGPGVLTGSELHTTGLGTVILRATQPGDAQFQPMSVRRSLHAGEVVLRPGNLRFEVWNGLTTADNQLDVTLLADPRFPAYPDFVGYAWEFSSRTLFPDDRHQGYGGRLSGFVSPPATGDYRFFLQSDDTSRLYVSTDEQPANLRLVAEETDCCSGFKEPNSSRTSAPIHLESGRRYYVEGIWKEGNGGDYLRVAWRREGDATPADQLVPIPASALSAWSPSVDLGPPEIVIPDPPGNLIGDIDRTSVDLLQWSLNALSDRYRLEATVQTPFPSSSDLTPDQRIDIIWFVDIDRDRQTGQSIEGNDYNIHLWLSREGWRWDWYKVSDAASTDGVVLDPTQFQIEIDGSKASLAFPANYLPSTTFDVWALCTTGNSANWPPYTENPATVRRTLIVPDPNDQTPPQWTLAVPRPEEALIGLRFDELLDTDSVEDVTHYLLNGSKPLSATLQWDQRGVDLIFDSVPTSLARLEIQGVRDLAGNSIQGTLVRTLKLLHSETFENLALHPNKDESLEEPEAWTHTPPDGWSVNNADFIATVIDPNAEPPNPDSDLDGYADLDGVTEWAGWSFTKRDWWRLAAGNQRRLEFLFGTGTIAVADPDEWTDRAHVPSLFNSQLLTREWSLSSLHSDTLQLSFHSSWRPEGFDDTSPNYLVGSGGEPINNQTAVITASFDGSQPVEVLRWDSGPTSPTYHDHFVNERVLLGIPVPPGSQAVRLSFSLLNAANDWWWAIDNLELSESRTPAEVVGRHVFYNQSAFDGGSADANASDDGAIATDKSALMPGFTASFANYTTYQRGLNGIMIDIRGLPGIPSASDFSIRVGNNALPAGWAPGPIPESITVRTGAGVQGSDRITLIWGANAAKRTWLQVTVLPTTATGLSQPDTFYFGNAVGDTGNSPADAKVTSTDALRVLANLTSTAAIGNRYDHNRDGRVGASDRLIVLSHLSALNPLELIQLADSNPSADSNLAPSGAQVEPPRELVESNRVTPASARWGSQIVRQVADALPSGRIGIRSLMASTTSAQATSLGDIPYHPSREITFSGGPVEILDNSNNQGMGNPYPAVISVPSMVGTVESVRVELTGFTHNFPDDVDIMLESPSGKRVILLSDAGGSMAASGLNLVFSDSATAYVPNGSGLASNHYRPTDYSDSSDVFPTLATSPSPAIELSHFRGESPSGNWKLYVVDDTRMDSGRMDRWSLKITTVATFVGPGDVDVVEGMQWTTGFSLLDDDLPGGTYTLALRSEDPSVVDSTAMAVIQDSQTQYRILGDPTPRASGSTTITILATNALGGVSSNGFKVVVKPLHRAFANATPLMIQGSGRADPYPSSILVADLPGSIVKAFVTLNNFTHPRLSDLDIILEAPNGQRWMLCSDAGGTTPLLGTWLHFDDEAPSALPDGNIVPTPWMPFRLSDHGTEPDLLPTPAPAPPYASSLSSLAGSNPNGRWSLYAWNDGTSEGGAIAGGWVLHLLTTQPMVADIDDVMMEEDTPRTIPIHIADADTALNELDVFAEVESPALLQVSFQRDSENHLLLELLPTSGASGTTTVNVTVSDRTSSSMISFGVTILPVNDPPAISAIPDQEYYSNRILSVPFTVHDDETASHQLIVDVVVEEPEFGTAFVEGDSSDRILHFIPSGLEGIAYVQVTTSDGDLMSTQRLAITIGPPYALRVSPIPDQVVLRDGHIEVPFTIEGSELDPEEILLMATWDDMTVIRMVLFIYDPGGNPAPKFIAVPSLVPGATGNTRIHIYASDRWGTGSSSFTVFVVPQHAQVVGRHVFYNQSAFDGGSADANASDDGAIATDKSALMPGFTASFANYTTYQRGLNGIMVDVLGLLGTPNATDFTFRVGNGLPTSAWATAPAPASVTVRPGAGVAGSDRITLVWDANAVKKQWLEITMLANANTGLAGPDVFYFGNAIGETGNAPSDARVTSTDALRILGNLAATSSVSSRYDINRDGRVGSADRLIVLSNLSAVEPLTLLDLSSGPSLLRNAFDASNLSIPIESFRVAGGIRMRLSIQEGNVDVLTRLAEESEWEIYETLSQTTPSLGYREVLVPVDLQESGRVFRCRLSTVSPESCMK